MVTTLVSARNQEGRVQVEGPNCKLQLSTDSARDLALNILQAATYAEADAFLFHWLRTAIGADAAAGYGLLSEFRQYREARTARPLEGTPLPAPGTPLPPIPRECIKCHAGLENGNDGPLCMLCLWPGRTTPGGTP